MKQNRFTFFVVLACACFAERLRADIIPILTTTPNGTTGGNVTLTASVTDAGSTLHQMQSSYPVTTNPGNLGSQSVSSTDTNADAGSASSGPFNYSYNATSVTGSNSISATASLGSGQVSARFDFFFNVSSTQNFTLSSTITANPYLTVTSQTVGEVVINDQTTFTEMIMENAPGTHTDTGVFVPGHLYWLGAENLTLSEFGSPNNIGVGPSSSASYNFTLNVPEPATFAMFAPASFLLLARRRAQDKARTKN